MATSARGFLMYIQNIVYLASKSQVSYPHNMQNVKRRKQYRKIQARLWPLVNVYARLEALMNDFDPQASDNWEQEMEMVSKAGQCCTALWHWWAVSVLLSPEIEAPSRSPSVEITTRQYSQSVEIVVYNCVPLVVIISPPAVTSDSPIWGTLSPLTCYLGSMVSNTYHGPFCSRCALWEGHGRLAVVEPTVVCGRFLWWHLLSVVGTLGR